MKCAACGHPRHPGAGCAGVVPAAIEDVVLTGKAWRRCRCGPFTTLPSEMRGDAAARERDARLAPAKRA